MALAIELKEITSFDSNFMILGVALYHQVGG